jgi:hypothetical protein
MQYYEQDGNASQWQLQIEKEGMGDKGELLSVQIKL